MLIGLGKFHFINKVVGGAFSNAAGRNLRMPAPPTRLKRSHWFVEKLP
jgi:hypothetical protein